MSLAVPTTQDISDNIVAQLEAALSQTITLLPKSFSRVLAKVLSGVFVLLYKYAGFSLLQMFVRHATMAPTTVNGKVIQPLLEWGRTIGVPDPAVATRAQVMIAVQVTTTGGTLAAGQELVRPETGVIYRTVGPVELNQNLVITPAIAWKDSSGGDASGEAGNTPELVWVDFVTPPPANVLRRAYISSVIEPGAEAEDVEAYRARVLEKFQKRPQGGAYADYQLWGQEVDGIVAVYPYTSDDPGFVDVYCEATEASSGSPDGVPTSGQLDQVLEAISLDQAGRATRRPANAKVRAFGITRQAFGVNVTGFSLFDPTKEVAVKDAIETALTEYFLSREPYIVGLSVPPRRDRITLAAVSGIVDQVVDADLGSITQVTVLFDGDPMSVYPLEKGEKAKLGTLTYV